MDLLSALVLGVVQGLTEFLPVSSSGHLVIGQHLLGWEEPNIFFDVSLHLGTFVAVVVVFRSEIAELVRGALAFFRRLIARSTAPLEAAEKMLLLVAAGSVPTALLGLFARHYLEQLFGSVLAVGVNLMITGCLLWLTRNRSTAAHLQVSDTRWGHALWIGLAQGLALAPGISRSGSTISIGLLLGLDRDWSGRFSFLLFIPAVLGAILLEMLDVQYDPAILSSTLAGTIVAGVTGYVALRLLLRIVHRGAFYRFAPYCWAVGLLCVGTALR